MKECSQRFFGNRKKSKQPTYLLIGKWIQNWYWYKKLHGLHKHNIEERKQDTEKYSLHCCKPLVNAQRSEKRWFYNFPVFLLILWRNGFSEVFTLPFWNLRSHIIYMLYYKTYSWQVYSIHFWLEFNEYWIFCLQFYISEDWKNTVQTSYWLYTFQTCFSSTPYLLSVLSTLGHVVIRSLALYLSITAQSCTVGTGTIPGSQTYIRRLNIN